MNRFLLKDLYLGFIDGKHEFNEIDEEYFEKSFFIQDSINFYEIFDNRKFIIRGTRGTGKTTILKYLSTKIKHERVFSFLLFKTDVSEEEKISLSRTVGIDHISFEKKNYGVVQDFKTLWRIIYTTKILLTISENDHCVGDITPVNKALERMKLFGDTENENNIIESILGLFSLKWRDISSGVEWEVSKNNRNDNSNEKITPHSLSRYLMSVIEKCEIKIPISIFIDEMEIFFKSEEQFQRDSDLIRDSIIVCEELRTLFKKKSKHIHIVIALRNEIISAIGARGEEVYKIVDDYSVNVDWSQKKNDNNHPLLKMLNQKMFTKFSGNDIELNSLFPYKIFNTPFYLYLTENTHGKPRNLISRLKLIQDKFPNENKMTAEMFYSTEVEYSSRLWKEIEYFLGASLPDTAISGVKHILYAENAQFSYANILDRLDKKEQFYQKEISALRKIGINTILELLFEYGAVGNSYFDKEFNRKIRGWSFRKQSSLQLDKPMRIQEGLWKHLSIVGSFE